MCESLFGPHDDCPQPEQKNLEPTAPSLDEQDTPTTLDVSPFQFLSLPSELREQIYTNYLVLASSTPQSKIRKWPVLETHTMACRGDLVGFLPALALTSRQMRNEVGHTLLLHAEKVVIEDPGDSIEFIDFFEKLGDWRDDFVAVLLPTVCAIGAAKVAVTRTTSSSTSQ